MANAKTPSDLTRPLSPHLQIYRPMLTMMMSIVHRITGAALYVGTLLLAWWLLAIASGANAYATFQASASSCCSATRGPCCITCWAGCAT